ncbi:fructose-bisphosphate aldolase class I [Candidatus Daviesbacteria bacterium]|nr:fructose-bisphosphate aldolase class I [Candidatus Daviesbacteria bacterium]
MDIATLQSTTRALFTRGKGIYAADVTTSSLKKRLVDLQILYYEGISLDYRLVLFSTPEIERYLSGIILYDETIRSRTKEGVSVPEFLTNRGIIPGIKLDQGTKEFTPFSKEKITEGLDGLSERLAEYKAMDARFAKWRAVITIGNGIPTRECIEANAQTLAKYALVCQEQDIVPIVEPEVLMEGDHDIKVCEEVTIQTLTSVFEYLKEFNVSLEGLILKTNMVLPGKGFPGQITSEEVARETVDMLTRVVPHEVAGIVFLSGGQTPQGAIGNLKAIARIPNKPWPITFSFERAIEMDAIKTWAGKDENITDAQKVFLERVKKVSEAL